MRVAYDTANDRQSTTPQSSDTHSAVPGRRVHRPLPAPAPRRFVDHPPTPIGIDRALLRPRRPPHTSADVVPPPPTSAAAPPHRPRPAAPPGGKTRSVCRGGSRPPLSLLSWHRPPPTRCHVTPPHFPPQHSIAAFHPRRLIVESLVTIFGDHSFYAFTPPTSPTLSANILIAHVRVRARSSRNAKHSFAFLYQRTHPLPCPRGEL